MQNWSTNRGTVPNPPEELSGDDFIEIMYLNGGKEKGFAKAWGWAWNTRGTSSYTITKYRVLKKHTVLTRFFAFISANQNEPAVFVASLMLFVCMAGAALSSILYLTVEVSRRFAILIPTLPLAYLINRFRKAN